MANWEWPSIEDKLEAIGYLAVPGVISAIEATVPIGKTEEFKKEYENKFSGEYPYEADKYGKQFRIYLNDAEGCPEFLKKHLDGAYGNRINNTPFIDELVKDYGFKFIKGVQDAKAIKEAVSRKHGGSDAFRKAFYAYRDFIEEIEKCVEKDSDLPNPQMINFDEKAIQKRSGKRIENSTGRANGFSSSQMLMLGWFGEEYIAYLLKIREPNLLNRLGIKLSDNYKLRLPIPKIGFAP